MSGVLATGGATLRQSAYNERLSEVYLRDALEVHPWRTRDPSRASIVYVPLWEVVSFNVGECNGTSHAQRMAQAAAALRASTLFSPNGRVARHSGFNHLIVSSGCIEQGARLEDRLTRRLASLLRASIVGRDRAYSPFYQQSAVGRCTVEVPYVSNPHARAAYMERSHRNDASSSSSTLLAGRLLSPAGGAGGGGGGGGRGNKKWLLSFMGSLDVCCDPGKSIRKAMRSLSIEERTETVEKGFDAAMEKLMIGAAPPPPKGYLMRRARAAAAALSASSSSASAAGATSSSNATAVQILHCARANGRPLPGRTPEEQLARYKAAGEQMAMSRFCLIPAGDNEVSSRLYSAMSAGCIPVVVANQLSGAFASLVPYNKFLVRVEQSTFIQNPTGLIARLKAMPLSEVAERRAKMLRHVADVTYDQTLRHERGGGGDTAVAGAEIVEADAALAAQPPPPPPPLTGGRSNRTRAAALQPRRASRRICCARPTRAACKGSRRPSAASTRNGTSTRPTTSGASTARAR